MNKLLLLAAALVLPSVALHAEPLSKLREGRPVLVSKGSAKPHPAPPSAPSRPDAARMVSVLRGKGTEPGTKPSPVLSAASRPSVAPAAPVIERKSRISAEAAPKGFSPGASGGAPRIKSGRPPATGEAEPPSPKVQHMKKGNTRPEGDSLPAPVKAGRIPAEGDPVPRPRPRKPSDGLLLAEGLSEPERGSYGTAPRPRPPQPAEIRYRVDASSRLSTDTVKFVKGGIELADQSSYDYLLALSEALRSDELIGERFVVEGHASAEGSDHANLVLSQRRANAIFDFLASRGVATDRLLAVGHGESQARFAEHEPEFLRAQDRQVIVFKLAE